MNGFIDGYYRFAVWITRFAYLNLLWIAFSLVGLGVVGFFPATAAMFAVVRKWVHGEKDIPVFQVFGKTIKRISENQCFRISTGWNRISYDNGISNFTDTGAYRLYDGKLCCCRIVFVIHCDCALSFPYLCPFSITGSGLYQMGTAYWNRSSFINHLSSGHRHGAYLPFVYYHSRCPLFLWRKCDRIYFDVGNAFNLCQNGGKPCINDVRRWNDWYG